MAPFNLLQQLDMAFSALPSQIFVTCRSRDTNRAIIKYHFAPCLSREEKNKTNKRRKELSCFSNRTR